jgi:hypothetical protein
VSECVWMERGSVCSVAKYAKRWVELLTVACANTYNTYPLRVLGQSPVGPGVLGGGKVGPGCVQWRAWGQRLPNDVRVRHARGLL